MQLKVSAISYMNTVPLMYDFIHSPSREELQGRFDVHFTLPATCAEELRSGATDIGIVPVAAYTSIRGLHIIPEVAIAAKHPVRSILLVSKKPLKQVTSVAADTSSRTSVALMKVLFEERFEGRPRFVPEPPDLKEMLGKHDAALLIGDPALRVDVESPEYQCYDLAHEWQQMTGLPFVFAFWTVREGALRVAREYDVNSVFRRSRDQGLANIDRVCEENAAQHGVSKEMAHCYLSYHLDYSLDSSNLRGLELFYRSAVRYGALDSVPELCFV